MTHKKLESILTNFPSQWRDGFLRGNALSKSPKKSFTSILVSGMGGSALPGKLLETYAAFEALPFLVRTWNTYGLPPSVPRNTLVCCISYSGNTEETISTFYEARKRKLPMLAIGTGGRLASLAKRTKTPIVEVPEAVAARFSLGYLFGGLAGALSKLRLLKQSAGEFDAAARHVSSPTLRKKGMRLAAALQKRIPLVYTQEEWKALGHIWKISLNETAKIPSFSYAIPELDHNEIEGFGDRKRHFPKIFAPVFLEDSHAPARLKKRFRLTKSIFQKDAGLNPLSIPLHGASRLEKIVSGTLLAYWASYFLATYYGVDPVRGRTIERFKRLMR